MHYQEHQSYGDLSKFLLLFGSFCVDHELNQFCKIDSIGKPTFGVYWECLRKLVGYISFFRNFNYYVKKSMIEKAIQS